MKIVVFQAGLGNQIFQYVYYLYLKKKFPNEKFYGYYPSRGLNNHNGLELDKWFDVKLPTSTRKSNLIGLILFWLSKICFRLSIKSPFTDNDWYRNPDATLYIGFWQNKKYVLAVDLPMFRSELQFGSENIRLKGLIEQTESVGVHVRRGDYSNPKVQHIYGNIGTLEYYQEAIEIIKKKISNPKFFFFSDDPDYVKKNFNEEEMEIVNCNQGD